jgi:hypothetical protein
LYITSSKTSYEQLQVKKAEARESLSPYPRFKVNLIRVYKKENAEKNYSKYKDIYLKGLRK